MPTYKLISVESLAAIKALAEKHGLLDEFKALGITVRDVEVDGEFDDTPMLPCNCFARKDGGTAHSGGCAGGYPATSAGIDAWEHSNGRRYQEPHRHPVSGETCYGVNGLYADTDCAICYTYQNRELVRIERERDEMQPYRNEQEGVC